MEDKSVVFDTIIDEYNKAENKEEFMAELASSCATVLMQNSVADFGDNSNVLSGEVGCNLLFHTMMFTDNLNMAARGLVNEMHNPESQMFKVKKHEVQ